MEESEGSVSEGQDREVTEDEDAFSATESKDCKLLYLERVPTIHNAPQQYTIIE